MNELIKDQIEAQMNDMKLDNANAIVESYKKQYPNDRDALFYECVILLLKGELIMAQSLADRAVRKFPTSYEAYYYQACVYQAMDMTLEALKSYIIALYIYDSLKIDNVSIKEDIELQIGILEKKIDTLQSEYLHNGDLNGIYKIYSFLQRKCVAFGKNDKTLRSSQILIVGKEYWVSDNDLRYVGVYRSPLQRFVGEDNYSAVRLQAEFLKFIQKGTSLNISGDAEEYLLPIATEKINNIHSIVEDGKRHQIVQYEAKHFNYYKVKNNTHIISNDTAYYGYPVPLVHKKERKKLVLSFFVDGLSQEVINGSDFAKFMPNTYLFFSKGTICTQAYSCSEWTYPSLATIESGLNTLSHMMFHNDIDGELPNDITTLTEYYKKKGYYTSKLDGEWRSIHAYGFARGLDQYVYQLQHMGSRVEQEIINVIEHLETFKDTDQYLWMTVGDLHDVADHLDLPNAVQKNLTLEERELDSKGKTSVKQSYSIRKISMYKKMLKYLDMLFGILFNYIENNFSDDEILISLFADHGQGYLIPENKPFLSKERTKVAFMFRGANVNQQITNELISTADYLPIMCRLSGIDYNKENIDGNLPEVFGGKEREYVITESLHPGDRYMAVVNTDKYEIYFENTSNTDDEGRFILKDYNVYGYYKGEEHSIIADKEILNKFEKIFIERIAEHIIY